MSLTTDLNCDVGESFGVYKLGYDADILDEVTSANIACGFHAGDPATMRATVRLALEKGVAIGAHPGLPDLVGFGRSDKPGRAADYSYLNHVLWMTAWMEANGLKLFRWW